MTNLCIKVTMVHLLFLATVYTVINRFSYSVQVTALILFLIVITCTCWSGVRRSRKIFRSVMQHGLSPNSQRTGTCAQRFTCVMVGKHVRNIQQTCSRVVLKESQPIVYLAAVLQDSCALGDVWWALDGPGMALSDAWTPSLLLWLLGPSWSWWPGLWRHAPPLLQNCSSERNNTACMILRDRNVFRRDLPYVLVCNCAQYAWNIQSPTASIQRCTWLSISCETNSFPVSIVNFLLTELLLAEVPSCDQ